MSKLIKTMILDLSKVLFDVVSRQFIHWEIPLNPVCSSYKESYISRVKLKLFSDYGNNSCVKAYGPWDDIELDSTQRTRCCVSVVAINTRTCYSVNLHVYLLSSLDLDNGPESIIGQASLAERKAVRRFPLFRRAEILARIVCHLASIWNGHNTTDLPLYIYKGKVIP